MNAGEMTDKELMKVSGEAEELLAGASMFRSADVVGELRRRYLLMLAERSAAKMEKVKVRGEGEQRTLNTFEEHKANDGSTRIIHAKREGLGTMTAIVMKDGEKSCISISDSDGRCVVCGDIMAGTTVALRVARAAMRAVMQIKKHRHNMHAKKLAKKTEGEVNGKDQQ